MLALRNGKNDSHKDAKDVRTDCPSDGNHVIPVRMERPLKLYLITAYSEWETLDIEARCSTDEQAMDKARRYGTLQYIDKNFPGVIFSHVVCHEATGLREVGTWEYQVRNVRRPGFIWHEGLWPDRPTAEDRAAARHWADDLAGGR